MKISVDIVANTGSFETDSKRAAKTAEREAKRIEAAFAKAGKAIGVGLAAGATALGFLVKKSIDAAAEMDDLAQKTGVSVEALSRLQYAAGLEGVEDLAGSLQKLAKNIAENGDTFAALGINVKTATGELRTTEDVIGDIAEVFAKSADGTRKAAIAQELFGKTGAQLIPLLNRGKAGLKELYEEADRLGITISSNTSKAADDFNNNLYRLTSTVKGAVNQITAGLLPSLTRITDAMVSSAGGTSAFEVAGRALGVVFETITVIGANVAYVFEGIGREIGGIAAQLAAIATGDFARAGFIREEMIADAQRARKEIDALSESIVNSKKAGAAEPELGKGELPDIEAIKKAAEEAAKARKKAAEEAQKEAEKALKDALDDEEKQRKSIEGIIDRLYEEGALMGASRAQIEARAAAVLGATSAEQEQIYMLAKTNEEREKAIRTTKALEEATKADTIAIEASARAYQRQIDDFGKGPAARRFSAGQNEIDDEFRSRVQGLQSDSAAGLLPEGIYEQELARLKKYHQEASDQWTNSFAEIEQKNSDFSAGLAETFQSYLDANSNLGLQLGDSLLSTLDSASNAVSDLTTKFVLWGQGGVEAVKAIGRSIVENVLSSLIDVGLQYVKNAVIQKVAIASTTAAGVAATHANTAAQVASNTAIAASAAPAAAATSLASFGANSGPAIAAILGVAAAAAIFTQGFKDGGYTGNGSQSQVSGFVHGQEFVANARATARYRTLLEQMNAGLPLNLPTVSDELTSKMDMGGGSKPTVNLRNVNAFDTQVIGDYFNSASGEQVFLNLVSRNGAKIRTEIGGG